MNPRRSAYTCVVLDNFTQQLAAGTPLDSQQVTVAVAALVDEVVSAEMKAAFLTALAKKGETTEEIAAFASELRDRSVPVPLDVETRAHEILDVCGTGGDRLNTFNISTTVALVCAAACITVAKHGNRAITSQAGSADVLEALGVPVELSPEQVAAALREKQFAFLFAPKFHPAFKHIGPARRLCAGRGQRTIFNFLGPLLNPARPSAQLIGVPRPELCEPMAKVLQGLGVRRGMVVCGEVPGSTGPAYLDELSTLGETTIAEFYHDRGFAVSRLSPQDFPLQAATLADLGGSDRAANAEIVRRVLGGHEHGPKRDAVLMNAGAALFLAGRARSFSDGWTLAAGLLDGGEAAAKLAQLSRPS